MVQDEFCRALDCNVVDEYSKYNITITTDAACSRS